MLINVQTLFYYYLIIQKEVFLEYYHTFVVLWLFFFFIILQISHEYVNVSDYMTNQAFEYFVIFFKGTRHSSLKDEIVRWNDRDDR